MSQTVTFKPSTLNFPPPLNKIVPASLILSNVSHSYAVFKIKSNAPGRYTVRPSKGVIGPEDQITVQVILSAMKSTPHSVSEFKSDRFLLEILPLPLQTDLTQASARVDEIIKSSPEKIEKSIIKASFKEIVRKSTPANGLEGPHGPESITSLHTPLPVPSSSLSSSSSSSSNNPTSPSVQNVSNQSFFSIADISASSIGQELSAPLFSPSHTPSFDPPHMAIDSFRSTHPDTPLNDSLTFRTSRPSSSGNQIASLNDKIDRLQAERDQLLDSLARLKSQVATSQKHHQSNVALARSSNIKLILIAIIFFILGNIFCLF